MYEEHKLNVVAFDSIDVFATAWFGSDIDGDAWDEFGIKPDRYAS